MKCVQFKKKISQYLEGALEENQHKEFEEHLESCSSCAEAFSHYLQIPNFAVNSENKKLDALFKRGFIREPAKEYWENLPGRILTQLPGQGEKAVRRGIFTYKIFSKTGLVWRLAGSVAVLGLVFFIGRSIYFSSIRKGPLTKQQYAATSFSEESESGREGESEIQPAPVEQGAEVGAVGQALKPSPSEPESPELAMADVSKTKDSAHAESVEEKKPVTVESIPETADSKTSQVREQIVAEENLLLEKQRRVSGNIMMVNQAKQADVKSELRLVTDEVEYVGRARLERYFQKLDEDTQNAKPMQVAAIESERANLLSEIYSMLLTTGALRLVQDQELALLAEASSTDSLKAKEAIFTLSRLYFTNAVQDTSEASSLVALSYWTEHQKTISQKVGFVLTERIIDILTSFLGR